MIRRYTLVLTLLGTLNVPAYAGVSHRVVLVTGTPVPGTESQTVISSFTGGPSFNNSGQMVVRTQFSGPLVDETNDAGLIFIESTGAINLITRKGDSTFLGPFLGMFKSFELKFVPVLRDNGKFSFYSTVTSMNTDLGTIWHANPSGLEELIAYEVLLADGFEFDETWNPFYVDFFNIALNQSGTAVYLGSLFPAPKNKNSVGTGLWLKQDGAPSGLLQATGKAPPPGQTIGEKFITFSKAALRNNGTLAFFVALANNDFDTLLDEGLYLYSNTTLQQTIYRGVEPFNTAPGETIRGFSAWPVFGTQGTLAFLADLADVDSNFNNDRAIIVDRGSGLEVATRTQNPAPGLPDGVTMTSFDVPMGDVDVGAPFRAGLSGPGITTLNDDALFRLLPDNAIQLIALSGQTLPGIAADEVILTISLLPAGNSRGQIAFRAELTGPDIPFGERTGFWATDTRGVIHKIARTGDVFEVAPGDNRVIAVIEALLGSGGDNGGAISLNENSEFAYKLLFDDGSEALVVATLVADTSHDLAGDDGIDSFDLLTFLGQWGFCEIRCEADFNNDGSVDGVDLIELLGAWDSCGIRCLADFNNDGIVNGTDLTTLLGNWGCTSDCIADINGDGLVDGIDLVLLLGEWG